MSDLTPTQDLIMELLSARDRLGDTWWPFATSHRKALAALESQGLVRTMHGIVEKTIRVRITKEGQEMYQIPPYGPGNWSPNTPRLS